LNPPSSPPQELGLSDHDVLAARQASSSWRDDLGSTVEQVTMHTQGSASDLECIARLSSWFPSYTSATVVTELDGCCCCCGGEEEEEEERGGWAAALTAAVAAAAGHCGLRWLKLLLHSAQQLHFCRRSPEQHPINSAAPPATGSARSIRRLHLELHLLPPPPQLARLSALPQLSHLRLSAGPCAATCTGAVEALAQLGAHLEGLHLEGPFSPAGLSLAPLAARLQGLTSLQLLSSYPEAVPAAGLGAALAGRAKLRELRLQGAACLLPALLDLPDLRHLSLHKCEPRPAAHRLYP
jgi:hypothetical protein